MSSFCRFLLEEKHGLQTVGRRGGDNIICKSIILVFAPAERPYSLFNFCIDAVLFSGNDF